MKCSAIYKFPNDFFVAEKQALECSVYLLRFRCPEKRRFRC